MDTSQPSPDQVDVHTAFSAIDAGAPLIDVREPAEFMEQHVPGAVLIPLADVPSRVGEIPSTGTVYVLCRSGHRSAMAVAWLRANGRPRAVNLDGGILAWARAGLPVR